MESGLSPNLVNGVLYITGRFTATANEEKIMIFLLKKLILAVAKVGFL